MSATVLAPLSVVSPYGTGPNLGAAEAAADTSNGNSFPNDGRTLLLVRNSDSSDHTVTIQGKSYAIPAGKSIPLGPFPVFEAFGTSVNVTADSATVKLLPFTVPDANSARR